MKGLDTNVLLRYIVADDPVQKKQASAYIRQNCSVDSPCFINRVVLCEFVWVLERRYRFTREEIIGALEKVLGANGFEVEDFDEALASLQQYREGNVDFADTLIGKTNRAQGCEETASFDKKASKAGVFVLIETPE